MISFCSQFVILGRKILSIQKLSNKAVLRVFHFSRANGATLYVHLPVQNCKNNITYMQKFQAYKPVTAVTAL